MTCCRVRRLRGVSIWLAMGHPGVLASTVPILPAGVAPGCANGSTESQERVVARSPDRATLPTAGLPGVLETCGRHPWHGPETMPQQRRSVIGSYQERDANECPVEQAGSLSQSSPRVGLGVSRAVHLAGVHGFQIAVAEDPGDDPKQREEPTKDPKG